VDLLAPGVRRHDCAISGRRIGGSPTFISYPHFPAVQRGRSGRWALPSPFEKGLEALGIPSLFSTAAGSRLFRRRTRHPAEIHGKPHLSAVSLVRTRSGPGNSLTGSGPEMGPAHRPVFAQYLAKVRAARQRRRRNRHRRPTVPDRFLGTEILAAARSNSIRLSVGTARELCC